MTKKAASNRSHNGHSSTSYSVITKDAFKLDIETWAGKIGVEPKEIHIRVMTRKWGSCSTAGRVTFNAELLTESDDLRKMVIVHELLHIKVPNHGPLFRALLRAYLGLERVEIPNPTHGNGSGRKPVRKTESR